MTELAVHIRFHDRIPHSRVPTAVSCLRATVLSSAHDAAHTGGVNGLSLDTWVSLGTLIAVGIGIVTFMRAETRSIRTELRSETHSLRAELHSESHSLRADLKADIQHLDERVGRLDDCVQRLDDRVYALAAGLKPTLERAAEAQGDD